MLVSTSFTYFLIGVPNQVVGAASIDSVTLSDNSYALVATRFGVPVAILFFALFFSISGICYLI